MSQKLPIAIILPHDSLAIPPELAERVALTSAHIFNEADAYTNLLYAFQDEVLYWVSFPYARALIDVNRPNDPMRIRPGDGIIKWQTSYGTAVYHPHQHPTPNEEQKLIARYWQPWHDQLNAIAHDPRVKLVFDCHSMAAIGPNLYDDPAQLRPRVSVSNWGNVQGESFDRNRPPTAPIELIQYAAQRLDDLFADVSPLVDVGANVAINRPFYGGYGLQAHGGVHQPWLMIEVNRALYIGAQTGTTAVVPPDPHRISILRQKLWQAITDITTYYLKEIL